MNEIIKKNINIEENVNLNIHQELTEKLNYFIETYKIPHIILRT